MCAANASRGGGFVQTPSDFPIFFFFIREYYKREFPRMASGGPSSTPGQPTAALPIQSTTQSNVPSSDQPTATPTIQYISLPPAEASIPPTYPWYAIEILGVPLWGFAIIVCVVVALIWAQNMHDAHHEKISTKKLSSNAPRNFIDG